MKLNILGILNVVVEAPDIKENLFLKHSEVLLLNLFWTVLCPSLFVFSGWSEYK